MKRILALLLALLTLTLCACKKDGNADSDDTSNQSEKMSVLIENGVSDYVIIVPHGQTDTFSRAYAMAGEIFQVTGVRLQVKQDTYDEQAKEILVGITSRKVSSDAITSLATPEDFAVTMAGEKLLIYGGTDQAVESAIAYFVDNIVKTTEGNTLQVPENLSYVFLSDAEYMTIDASYVIVADDDYKEYAKSLQATLKKKAGLDLPIKAITDEAQKKEILVGNAKRKTAYETEQAITSPFAGVMRVSGSRFMLLGKSDYVVKATAELFAQTIEQYMFGGRVMLKADLYEAASVGDAIAKDVLESINFNNIKWDANVNVEEFSVYVPDGTNDAWYYSHHPFVTYFKGTYYLFYSSSRRNEDDCGQRIMMATSKDFEHWDLKVFMDAPKATYDANVERVLTAAGVYIYEDTLNFYFFDFEYTQDCIRYGVADYQNAIRPLADDTKKTKIGHFVTTTKDGESWTEPQKIGVGLTAGNMNPKKYTYADGKEVLIWVGFGTGGLALTEDLTGLSGWQNVKLSIHESVENVKNPDLPVENTESSIYQLSDGTLIHFSRTNCTCNSLASASFDGGKTWTPMYESGFKDFGAKFEFGTLPDGRYYYLGNLSTQRAELVLMVSTDGVNFDQGYYLGDTYYKGKEGLYKGGNYGYPTSYMDDKYLYVVYSKDKEAVGVTRVALRELGVVVK